MEVFIGQICAFGFNYSPLYFQMCQGQILQIQQYSALFALLGVQYGGNGTSTFGLPNLMGRRALGFGTGAGLPQYLMGQSAGSTTATMTLANLPNHTHTATLTLNVDQNGNQGTASSPQNASIGTSNNTTCYQTIAGTNQYLQICPNNQALLDASGTAAPTAFSVQAPALAMNYCIAIEGIFPTRQ